MNKSNRISEKISDLRSWIRSSGPWGSKRGSVPWLNLAIIAALALFWWLSRERSDEQLVIEESDDSRRGRPSPGKQEGGPVAAAQEAIQNVVGALQGERGREEKTSAKPDDLARIVGIGPKVASLLVKNNIRTFQELATTQVARLQQILDEANLNMIDPRTWPEQALLASEGRWEDLVDYQGKIKSSGIVD